MSSIFSKYKDVLIDISDTEHKKDLKYPLQKIGDIVNGYTRGDFIIVGGKKTSGKSSFVLNNYVNYPLLKRSTSKADGKDINIKIIYISTKRTVKSTLEKLIVNYAANKNGLCKLGVPSLYGLSGSHEKVTRNLAKSVISSVMTTYDQFSDRGILTLVAGRKSIYEITLLIKTSLSEYGEYNEELEEFVYKPEYSNMVPIVSIDDVSGITIESSASEESGLRASASAQIAIELKTIAKTYGVLLVLVVPSGPVYTSTNHYSSSIDEIMPYHIYADRVLLLKNPAENEKFNNALGYAIPKFISRTTGTCYFRSLYVAANYMGASGVYLPLFMYPENGAFLELPPASDDEDDDNPLMDFYDITQSKSTIKDNFFRNK